MRAALTTTALISLLTAACGQNLSVEVVQPAELSMGAAQTFVLTEGFGRSTAQDLVSDELAHHFDEGGYYGFLDHSRYERLDLRAGQLDLPRTDIPGDGAWLRVDVLEWYAFDEEDVEVITDAEGYVLEEHWTVTTHALALLAITAVAEDGTVLLHDVEYEGAFTEVNSELSFDEAIQTAGAAALVAFVQDVTPNRVRQAIRLDDTVDEHGHAIEVARAGQLDVAIAEMERFVADNPEQSPALYNLAAFYDAAGDYDLALSFYAAALERGGATWYANTRTDCEQRREWAQALGR